MTTDPERDNPAGHDTIEHRPFDLVEALRRSEAQVLASSLAPTTERERARAGKSWGIEL